MIQNKKISSYMLYAIGEIILVVIGILIAVNIEDWNSEMKKKASQYEFLVALELEFLEIKSRLSQVRKVNQTNIEVAREFSMLMGISTDSVSPEKLRSLAIGTIATKV